MNRKIITFFIILITLANAIMPVAQATQIITKANLINDHKINTHLLYYNDKKDQWRNIQCGYICYSFEGEKYPAYCIIPNTNGVDEEGAYTVTVDKLVNNTLIYNILINGYPYKTPSQLGVKNADDAYVATKLALKNALLNRDVTGFYKAEDEEGEKILKAMFEIIEKGKNGNKLNKDATISINSKSEFVENENYYYQEFIVTADANISEYSIDSIENFPSGSHITDANGNKKEKFLAGEKFRVMIPKNKLNEDVSGKINVTASCNTNPIFYGEAPDSTIQDYAITYKPNVNYNATTTLSKTTNTASIKIIKQDAENLKPIKDVTFALYNNQDEYITSKTTNENGIVIFDNLYQGTYKIKEIKANENFISSDDTYEINTEYNKEVIKTITNIHKKGNLKITKVDKDDKTLTLGAIEFDLINEDGNTIAHLITDVNGETYIENINIGKYTLKETKTKREYNLCENEDIIVEWNKTADVVIENEKQKGKIKVIKQDSEKNEIKLEGVKFQIYDINNKVVDEIITDKNGEAYSSKLLIGEYKVKEIDLGKNVNYLLNNEIYNVKVENEKITELVVENEHKKGNLKILKTDKDNNNITLEGVEFEIIDEFGDVYKTVTNEEGIAIVNDIRVGKVKIKEVKTNDNYLLNSEVIETEIKHNECFEILIQNEKKKGQVEIYKTEKDNKQVKIPNVEFEILDENNNVVDKLITNTEGYAISKKIPVGKYYLKEIKTNSKYLLNEDLLKVNMEFNKIACLNIENEKITGKIQIIKTSSDNSPILNISQGEALENVEFQIFDMKDKLVDTVITDKNGIATTKKLELGRYKVVEKSTNKYYLLNKKEYFINIEKNGDIKILQIENDPIIPRVEIEKIGQQFAEKNQEIKYEFNIKNSSNSELNEFTWIEYIPYDKCKLTKMVTGVYNEELEYEIYYKTDKNDYKLLKKLNTLTSEYINFDEIELEKEETITQIKVEYGIVSENFNSIVKPYIYAKVNENVKKDEKILNITELSGKVKDYIVKTKSSFETIIEEKEIIKKLPKTGC